MSISGSAEHAERAASELKWLDFAPRVSMVRKDFSDHTADHFLPTEP